MAKEFQISDEDIDAMVRHLEFTDPKNATRKYAREKFESLQAGLRSMAITNPEKFAKIRAKIDVDKKKNPES